MNNSDFEGPPFMWSLISIVGGFATAIAIISGLELSADHLRTYFYGPSQTTSSASSTDVNHP